MNMTVKNPHDGSPVISKCDELQCWLVIAGQISKTDWLL